jgi:transposase
MPNPGLAMLAIKEILRLKYEAQLSQRQIAHSLQLSVGVVSKYLRRAQVQQISWPLPVEWTAAELLQRLGGAGQDSATPPTTPDFAQLHQELQRKGVTRQLLWEEYALTTPQPLSYARFCALYREWKRRLHPTLRQTHTGGDKLFLDYCGPTVEVIDRETGEVRAAQIFVAVLGASNYTYVEATWTQSLPDWLTAQVRALEFFGGVPRLLVPDNLKSAVTKACRYEPVLNRSYQEFLEHYGTAALPARPYKPRDKAKVEVGVQIVERWLLARVRKQTFFSLEELNQTLHTLLRTLNERPFKKLPGSRLSWFQELEQPLLKPLPPQRYYYAQWKKARVHLDYHIEVDGHYYSVPHAYLRQEVDVRVTALTIEILQHGKRLAAHPRSARKGAHTTLAEHLPKAHQAHLAWSPTRFLTWAADIGPATQEIVRYLLEQRRHPEIGYRSCLGLLALAKRYSPARLEAACQHALALGARSRRSIASILEKGLEAQPLPTEPLQLALPAHENIRGAGYYH